MPVSYPEIGVIVLAAGGSTRMGRPKQLLPWRGRTLVRRAVETALAVGGPVVVVIGAEPVRSELQDLPIDVVENSQWSRGMGSSIRTGVQRAITVHAQLDAVILMLCDQPEVTADTLVRLIEAQRKTGKGLCAAEFDATFGPPVLFTRAYFDRLLAIPDEQGARHLLLAYADDLLRVPCPEAALDLDTWSDYERLMTSRDTGF